MSAVRAGRGGPVGLAALVLAASVGLGPTPSAWSATGVSTAGSGATGVSTAGSGATGVSTAGSGATGVSTAGSGATGISTAGSSITDAAAASAIGGVAADVGPDGTVALPDVTAGSALTWLTGGITYQTAGDGSSAAAQAAEQTQFAGTLVVQWSDGEGSHSVPLHVTGTGGVVSLTGGRPIVATPDTRLLQQPAGWSLVGPGDTSAWGASPPVTAKYTVSSEAGPDVAGRPTTLVELWTHQDQLDEQVFLDVATGMVLRREQFDGGQPVRVVGFTAIHIGSAPAGAAPVVRRDERPRQLQAAALPAPFVAPDVLGAGYALVGVLRHQHVVQVLYSDGLHSLSVFEQMGALNVGAMPRSGQPVAVGPARGIRYRWSGGNVVTWPRGGVTVTVVGDGPLADVLAAATSVPPPRRLSFPQTVRLTSRRLLVEMWQPG